jgi:hypothetical protein
MPERVDDQHGVLATENVPGIDGKLDVAKLQMYS